MSFPAILVLEDGTVIEGTGFGVKKPSVGEIVFNTSMSGYQEIITDPWSLSFAVNALVSMFEIPIVFFDSKKLSRD